jgi:UDP:flavonoid glycosyltransferase YjiC (YdhE family)
MTVDDTTRMIKGAHVVAFPFPAGGHLARFIPFAKSLARNGLTITFITTIPHLANARRALVENNSFEARENIRLVSFDLPAEYAEVNRKNFIAMIQVTNNMRDQLCELMTGLMKPNGVTSDISQSSDSRFGPPVCIISDMFLAWTQVRH